jgi:hypothetical protein
VAWGDPAVVACRLAAWRALDLAVPEREGLLALRDPRDGVQNMILTMTSLKESHDTKTTTWTTAFWWAAMKRLRVALMKTKRRTSWMMTTKMKHPGLRDNELKSPKTTRTRKEMRWNQRHLADRAGGETLLTMTMIETFSKETRSQKDGIAVCRRGLHWANISYLT